MPGRVIEIATDGAAAGRDRGSMTVTLPGAGTERVPLDDMAVLLCTARSATLSASLLTELASRGVAAVLCGENFLPAAWLWPVEGHHVQALHMRHQLNASLPLRKRLWQAVVREKITRQQAALKQLQLPERALDGMAARVRSGDPDNIEAQAARLYWPLLFGSDFRRARGGDWPNAALNYGYTVLRAAVARAVVAAGLHPSIGIHHSNRGDSFCLADDLMEPYRPVVDLEAARLTADGATELSRDEKRVLAELLSADMETDQGTSPLQLCIERTAQSLARSFETGEPSLAFPKVLQLPFAEAPALPDDE